MKRTMMIWAATMTGLLALSSAFAVPMTVNYSGRLEAQNGLPYDGEVDVMASLWNAATGGTNLLEQDFGTILVENGLLRVALNDAALANVIKTNDAVWIQFTLDGEPMMPRQMLTSVPYALKADDSLSLGGVLAGNFVKKSDKVANAALPTNGLAWVSNGGMSNEFADVKSSWAGPAQNITDYPGLGAQAMVTAAEGSNSYMTDLTIYTQFSLTLNSFVEVILVPPAGTGVGAITLYNNASGKLNAGTYADTWTPGNLPALTALLNKNVAGAWTLTIVDTTQDAAPGTVVGSLQKFDVEYDAVRSNHIKINGKLDVAGDITATGMVKATGFQGDGSLLKGITPIIGVTVFESATRKPLAGAVSITMESFMVNKKSPTSILLIDGSISGHTNASGSMQQGWKYGAGAEVLGQGLMYEANVHAKAFPTKAIISGHTTTGPQTLVFRYFCPNGDGGNRPFAVYNPNGSDDGRLGQTRSIYTVWEIEPNF